MPTLFPLHISLESFNVAVTDRSRVGPSDRHVARCLHLLQSRAMLRRCLSTAPRSAPLRTLLAGFVPPENAGSTLTGSIAPSWMQGATTFGRCSAGLCLLGAQHVLEDPAMPLRSANVDFVGAAGGDVTIQATTIRKGKNSSIVRADVIGEKGLATTATFTFANERASALEARNFVPPPPSDLPPPHACQTLQDALGVQPPQFFEHFELRIATRGQVDATGGAASNWMWVRHAEANGSTGGVDGVDAAVALVALADTPPPAIVILLTGSGAIDKFPNVSSLTWHVNFVDRTPTPAHDGGWWLIEQRIEHLRGGFSSCDMALWGGDTSRGPVLVSRQAIAVYA